MRAYHGVVRVRAGVGVLEEDLGRPEDGLGSMAAINQLGNVYTMQDAI